MITLSTHLCSRDEFEKCKKYSYICKKVEIMARTVTVSLGKHYEDFIQSNIKSGRYNNTSEVIRAALRKMEEDEAKIAAFCNAIDEGDASPDVIDFNAEDFIKEILDDTKIRIIRILHERMDFPRHL